VQIRSTTRQLGAHLHNGPVNQVCNVHTMYRVLRTGFKWHP
jgi:hypothetical protein